MKRERGFALLLSLVVIVLLHALVAVAFWSVLAEQRTITSVRLGIEGDIIASSALATARNDHRGVLEALLPGESVVLPSLMIDAWRVEVRAWRAADLVVVHVDAEFRSTNDSLLGARSKTLVLARGASDTLRVLRGRSRF